MAMIFSCAGAAAGFWAKVNTDKATIVETSAKRLKVLLLFERQKKYAFGKVSATREKSGAPSLRVLCERVGLFVLPV
jgi:hypothetical protein